ncbi:MAG: hypothetical protein ACRD0J_15560 [Acidimicrobiales bacterium]
MPMPDTSLPAGDGAISTVVGEIPARSVVVVHGRPDAVLRSALRAAGHRFVGLAGTTQVWACPSPTSAEPSILEQEEHRDHIHAFPIAQD